MHRALHIPEQDLAAEVSLLYTDFWFDWLLLQYFWLMLNCLLFFILHAGCIAFPITPDVVHLTFEMYLLPVYCQTVFFNTKQPSEQSCVLWVILSQSHIVQLSVTVTHDSYQLQYHFSNCFVVQV